MKLNLFHHRIVLLQFCTLLLFLFCADAARSSAQSSKSSEADAASRAAETYKQGMTALQQGDLVSARADFEKVVRLAPTSPEGHNSLGWVLLAQGEIVPAIAQFRTALKLKPEFVQAHVNLGNALI